MKKILVLGDTGLVGQAIIRRMHANYEIVGVSRSDFKTDLWKHIPFNLESESISDILTVERPDYIVSCTRGDYQKQLTLHRDILVYMTGRETKLAFFSTANVFDGLANSIKTERDIVNATSEYGKFKIECEKIFMDGLPEQSIILRLPMVFGDQSPRVKEIIQAIRHEKKMPIYENLIFTTIWDDDVAMMLEYILKSELTGIFHLTSSDVINHMTFHSRILTKRADVELGKVGHEATYYLALKSTRSELEAFSYANESVIKRIKKVVKRDK